MSAPAVVRIDVAALAAEAAAADDRTPLERELLTAAQRCALGDATQPPRRELVAAAFREAERQRTRGNAEVARQEARADRLDRELQALRLTQQGLVLLHAECLAYLAAHFQCRPASRDVLAAIRARQGDPGPSRHAGGPDV